jgi:hypothetical protein
MKKVCTVELLQKDLSEINKNATVKIALTNKSKTKVAFLSLVSVSNAPVPTPDGEIKEMCLLQAYVSDEYFDTPLNQGDNNENNRNH